MDKNKIALSDSVYKLINGKAIYYGRYEGILNNEKIVEKNFYQSLSAEVYTINH